MTVSTLPPVSNSSAGGRSQRSQMASKRAKRLPNFPAPSIFLFHICKPKQIILTHCICSTFDPAEGFDYYIAKFIIGRLKGFILVWEKQLILNQQLSTHSGIPKSVLTGSNTSLHQTKAIKAGGGDDTAAEKGKEYDLHSFLWVPLRNRAEFEGLKPQSLAQIGTQWKASETYFFQIQKPTLLLLIK